MTFFSFLYNTLQPRVNSRANKRFWLPGVLQGIDNPNPAVGGKLLPLKGLSWPLGKIEGEAGQTITLSIIGAARPLIEPAQIKPYMDDPYAAVSMNDGIVMGLDNIFVYPDPSIYESPEGYEATIELKFEAYDDLPKFCINGSYRLDQKVEIQDSSQPKVRTITGTGTFTSQITNVKLQADVKVRIAGSGSSRKPMLMIAQLRLVSITGIGSPVFDTKVITINAEPGFEEIWRNLSNTALNDSKTRATMLQNLINTLNEPQNLHSLSTTLNQQFENVLNNLLGKAEHLPSDSSNEVSNVADLYLFDRLRVAFNNPDSHLYLPRQLLSINSPKVEPLNIDQIDIGAQNIAGLSWQPNILDQIKINGLANSLAKAENIRLQQPLLTVFTSQGALSSHGRMVDGKEIPAAPLKIYANFSLSPPGDISPVTGTLTVSVSNSQLEILVTVADTMLDDLVITLKKMMIKVDLNLIKIDLNITSDSRMNGMANLLVNQDSIKQQLVEQLNEQLKNNLTSISQQVSESIVQYSKNALDN